MFSMEKFRYILNVSGYPSQFGYTSDGTELTGTEPFSGFDIANWRKDLTTGEWVKIEPEPDFPYEGRNIRVELTNEQIAHILLDEQTRPIIEWAYHLPNRKTDTGVVLLFIDFENTLMSQEDTEALLLSLGAIITRKTN